VEPNTCTDRLGAPLFGAAYHVASVPLLAFVPEMGGLALVCSSLPATAPRSSHATSIAASTGAQLPRGSLGRRSRNCRLSRHEAVGLLRLRCRPASQG
jgi:hypothetical protein